MVTPPAFAAAELPDCARSAPESPDVASPDTIEAAPLLPLSAVEIRTEPDAPFDDSPDIMDTSPPASIESPPEILIAPWEPAARLTSLSDTTRRPPSVPTSDDAPADTITSPDDPAESPLVT